MIDPIILQALMRLSPQMIVYHVKRVLRNRFSAKFPAAYARYIDNVKSRVPLLTISARDQSMARNVATFYNNSYSSETASAAKGQFTFLGQLVDFGAPSAVDWHHKLSSERDFHLWRQKLGHMGFICPMLINGDEAELDAVSKFIRGFCDQSDFGKADCYSSVWFPYSASHRVLAILSGYLIARSSRNLPAALQSQIEDFLRWNVAFIFANIEHELRNNHVERNLAALCFYYSHTESVTKKTASRLDRDVATLIRDTILPDGLSAERSAMYQGLSVMALQIFSQTHFLSPATRSLAKIRLHQAERAWRFMTHPDGDISLFNDSWFGEVPYPSECQSESDFDKCDVLPYAGYGRFQERDIFALFDAGPIGPSWNPGHGHADFLSVEIDVAGHRFIVDPGTFQYSTGTRRDHDRAAASHNGPVYVGHEPVRYKGAFRVGKLASARLQTDRRANGSLVGELDVALGILRRHVTLAGGVLRIKDSWRPEPVSGRVRILVPSEWIIASQEDDRIVFCRDYNTAVITVTSGSIKDVRMGYWCCSYLHDKPAHVIDMTPCESSTLEWSVSSHDNIPRE